MVEGFMYVPADEDGPMAGARPGDRVVLPELGPPWLVVDHTIERVLVTRWPGMLLRVVVLDPTTARERANLDQAAKDIRRHAGYSRALGVDILEEMSPGVLFGPNGHAIIPLLDAAGALTRDEAVTLAEGRHPGADGAAQQVWGRWYGRVVGPGTLTVHVPGLPVGSPVGSGLLTIHDAVWKAAQARGGPEAFAPDTDPDEEGDLVMCQPWSGAASALLDAALALGAPELGDEAATEALMQGWRRFTAA